MVQCALGAIVPPEAGRPFQSPRLQYYTKTYTMQAGGKGLQMFLDPDNDETRKLLIDPRNYVGVFVMFDFSHQYVAMTYDDQIDVHEVIGVNIEEQDEDEKLFLVSIDFIYQEVTDPATLDEVGRAVAECISQI